MESISRGMHPTVWLLGETLPDRLRHVRVLKLPAPILQSISRLEPVVPKVPPVASLHDTLAAFSRGIVAFEPFADQLTSQRWLYTRRQSAINPHRLFTLIKAWLIAT